MKELTKIILVATAGVVALDALASVTSRIIGLPYALVSVVTLAIYCATGFYATRYCGLKKGLLASAMIGFMDSTLGWTIAWIIGPGKPAGETVAIGGIALTILTVVLVATISGLLGGFLSKLLPPIEQSPM